MTRPLARSAGFTIVEMIVVLMILGVVTAVAAPALFRGGSGEDDVSRAAAEVEVLLRSARRLAVEQGATATLVLDPSGTRYWLEVAGDAAAARDGVLDLPQGVSLWAAEERAIFAFHPLGGASGGIVAVRGAGRELRIGVDPWTGELHVEGR